MFRCVYISQFVYPLTCCRTLAFFHLSVTVDNAAVSVETQISLRDSIFNLFFF